jgi:GTPase SAR1 family protein
MSYPIFNTEEDDINNYIKIFVIGDSNTGKTSVIKKFIQNKSNIDSTLPTVDLDIFIKNIITFTDNIKVKFYDFSGKTDLSILKNYLSYTEKDIFILFYDINNIKTFINLVKYIEKINKMTNIKYIFNIIGNKIKNNSTENITEIIDNFIKFNKNINHYSLLERTFESCIIEIINKQNNNNIIEKKYDNKLNCTIL